MEISNDDITILCCINRLISMNRFEIFGLNDEQEYLTNKSIDYTNNAFDLAEIS